MRNVNGQAVCPKCKLINTSCDTRNVSKKLKLLTSTEIEFLEFFNSTDNPNLVKSLQLIHDFAIYHSDISFDCEEKTALYDVRVLWEKIEEMIE